MIPKIKEKFASSIGREIDGQRVTLSGLCGIVSRAGMRGAARWLESEKDRKRYPATTEIFKATNGLF